MSYSSTPATVVGLQEALQRDCRILHVACHGESANALRDKMGRFMYDALKTQIPGDFLLFEDPVGMCHAVTAGVIDILLESVELSPKLDCILLAASHSLSVGKRFQQKGAPHVICANGAVGTTAMRIFLESFYNAILKQNMDVSVAFEETVATI